MLRDLNLSYLLFNCVESLSVIQTIIQNISSHQYSDADHLVRCGSEPKNVLGAIQKFPGVKLLSTCFNLQTCVKV